MRQANEALNKWERKMQKKTLNLSIKTVNKGAFVRPGMIYNKV
jgi:hypothetical protein